MPATIDLKTAAPGASVIGADPVDGIGRRLATGDFNGDGVDDIVLGAPRADGPGTGTACTPPGGQTQTGDRCDAGEVYVIFGSPGLSGTKDLASSPPNLIVYGADPGDLLGTAVAAGNINGDNTGGSGPKPVEDIIIGSPNADGPGNGLAESGEVYVIFGSTGLSGSRDIALGQQNVTLFGADPGDVLGRAVAAADVNGNGVADILAGAPLGDGPGNTRSAGGEAYVVFGSAILSGAVSPDLTMVGAEALDGLGSAVAGGNVNGTGPADIVVSADDAGGPGNSRALAGEVYVFFGAAFTSGTSLDAASANLTVYGAEPGDNLGSRLAVGDVNGGAADILMTAQGADGPSNQRSEAGEAYVVFGSGAFPATVDIALSQQSLTIFAADELDEVSSIAVGNVNGDGFGDILFGSDDGDGPGTTPECGGNATGNRCDAGEAYVIHGSSGLSGTRDVCQGIGCAGGSQGAAPNVTIFGADPADDLGPVASGDVNGNSVDDIVLGAAGADGPGTGTACTPLGSPTQTGDRCTAGEVYVLFGSASTTDTDGDGWTDVAEGIIGTDPFSKCATSPSDNAWPPDFNNDTAVTGADLSVVAGNIGNTVPPAPARSDIAPDPPDGAITGGDLSAVAGRIGHTCL